MQIKAIFRNQCPNCGGDISDLRLSLGLPCSRCLREPVGREDLCSALKDKRGDILVLCKLKEEEEVFHKLFNDLIGSNPWSLQITWARRFFLGHSFALLAPTGVGKTTFGLVLSRYLRDKGKKSYLIFPTQLLVEQAGEKLKKLGVGEEELLYYGKGLKKQESVKLKERIKNGDFKILVTTAMFLYKNVDIIPKGVYDLIFIDDVDSFLKTAKNVDKALLLMGFDQNDIEKTLLFIDWRRKVLRRKVDEKIISVWRRKEETVKKLAEKRNGVLIVSSATSNPRSSRILLFKELLGFEVGRPLFFLRNVIDVKWEGLWENRLVDIIRKLGSGGLLFVSSDEGRNRVIELKEFLEEKGIRSATYEELDRVKEAYERGEVKVLIGIASYRNPLARGFDMPHIVKYAIFTSVPKMVFTLNIEENPSHVLWSFLTLRPLVAKRRELSHLMRRIDAIIRILKSFAFMREEELEREPRLRRKFEDIRKEAKEIIESPEIRRLIEKSQEITLKETEEGLKLVVADVTGYLQASGRTSRLYPGGLSKGLSIINVDDRKAFTNLIKKIRWFNPDIKFFEKADIDLEGFIREIEEERKKIREFLRGERKPGEGRELIKTTFVVVESPHKAKTIAGFFGKPLRRKVGELDVMEISTGERYLIIGASKGHILDLATNIGYHGVLREDARFAPVYTPIRRCPICGQQTVEEICPRDKVRTLPEKESIISSIRKIALEADEILVATDPDTEGEKIGWDLTLIMKPYSKDIKRMEFHEVTRRAILEAMENPREIDEALVNAQILRRISDRWVGFELSQMIQRDFRKSWLSAGRVQTPVLGWVIDREKSRKIKKGIVEIILEFNPPYILSFEFDTIKEAREFFGKLEEVKVEVMEEKEEMYNPPPPFSTDLMLREASRKLKKGVKEIMALAQALFEAGLITYHRTDSTRISAQGIEVAREFIIENFGGELFKARTWGEGGAHEGIRPTRSLDPEELKTLILSGEFPMLTRDHVALYSLIFERFIASQMKPIKVLEVKIKVKALTKEMIVNLPVKILERGFNLIYPLKIYRVKKGVFKLKASHKKLRIVPKVYPYTQGTLVEEMKKRGLGRPSTYAVVIDRLLERGYIVERGGFLYPTELGKSVYKHIFDRYREAAHFVTEEFTRELEDMMLQVEEGKADYMKILGELYKELEKFKMAYRRA